MGKLESKVTIEPSLLQPLATQLASLIPMSFPQFWPGNEASVYHFYIWLFGYEME